MALVLRGSVQVAVSHGVLFRICFSKVHCGGAKELLLGLIDRFLLYCRKITL